MKSLGSKLPYIAGRKKRMKMRRPFGGGDGDSDTAVGGDREQEVALVTASALTM